MSFETTGCTPARLLERLQLSHAQLPGDAVKRDLKHQQGVCTETGCQLEGESCWAAGLASHLDTPSSCYLVAEQAQS